MAARKQMGKTKVMLRQHFCGKCNKEAVERIEFPLGLSASGPHTNNYCLACDARLRKRDIKEVESTFHCPECNSFLRNTTMNVCSGCGEFLSRIRLDRRMFSLPQEEFKKELVALLQSSIPEEPKDKHKIDLREFTCPYCLNKETIKVSEEMWDEKAKGWAGTSMDYWECPQCGEENDIGLECFEGEFAPYKKFTEREDWKGLHSLCTKECPFDEMMLVFLAKQYLQKRDFEKAMGIASVLMWIDPENSESEVIRKKAEKGESMKTKQRCTPHDA